MSLTRVFLYIYNILKARVHSVVSVKIAEEGIPWASPSTKPPINGGKKKKPRRKKKLSVSTLSEIWQLVKGLQQPGEHMILRKATKDQWEVHVAFFSFSGPMSPPPLPSSGEVVKLATGFPVWVPGPAGNRADPFSVSVVICLDHPNTNGGWFPKGQVQRACLSTT